MTTDSIRTTIADAALAGVTDDPDVTAGVADIAPSATLTACRSGPRMPDFEDFAGVNGVEV
jgi:hypothetical protein